MKNCQLVPLSIIKPEGYHRFLSKTKLEALIVPVRMRGLTSSGAIGKCYYNVANLVEIFGGEVVLGWAVTNDVTQVKVKHNEYHYVHVVKLLGHAIWLNDENKLSDPTAKSWLSEEDFYLKESDFFGVMWKNDNAYIQFVPLKTTNENLPYLPNSIDLEKVVDNDGKVVKDWKVYVHDDDKDERVGKINWIDIKSSLNDKNFLVNYEIPSSKIDNTFRMQYRHRVGRFSERSVVTGRSLEEIRASRSKIH